MVQVLSPVVVGRDAELDRLDAMLAAARVGDGATVVLSGEAGIGKSRLAREVLARAAGAGMSTAAGRAVPSGGGAYRPLTEALLQALRHRPVLDDPGLQAWLPGLAGIVPVRLDPAEATDVSAAVRGESVVQLLARLARPDGLVLLLEDLHWADPDTVALVEYVVDNGGGQHLLTVCTVRSGEPSPALDLIRRLHGRPGAVHLQLARLDHAAVADMVRACAPDVTQSAAERIERSAEGVPLLVEELLASPGASTSFADTVRERLARFDPAGRHLLEAAAVLGRHFDWRLLGPTTALAEDTVVSALEVAVERMLLQVDGDGFRFRHALTREAVLADTLPPRQVALATAALAALQAARPELDGPGRALAADLAARAGDLEEAATQLTAMGHDDLQRGALATAVATLGRALELAPGRSDTALLLVEALAQAGRVDEAVAAARAVPGESPGERARLHLRLAQGAVAAGRWAMAAEHIVVARQAVAEGDDASLSAALSVLEAEVALAGDDMEAARSRADAALGVASDPAVRCHALEVLGRVARLADRGAARALFEQAMAEADGGGLAVWRVRALHEVGTIDMLERAATDRLEQARQGALRVGALSTAAVVGLQLAATSICRWEPAAAVEHARASLELAEALRLDEVREKALLFLAEAAALGGDAEAAEGHLVASGAPSRSGTASEGLCWGIRGEAALMGGDVEDARRLFEKGAGIMARHPHAEPAAFRAEWPLLLAVTGDRRAPQAVDEARRLGVDVFNLNRGLIGYAEAVLAGAGDTAAAQALAVDADGGFVNATVWRVLARTLCARAAGAQGWGDPVRWLEEGVDVFAERDLPALVELCRRSQADAGPHPWERAGLTGRERDVLELVVRGLANKEIAQHLHVSARTVEKHVEALLRKTDARSRTQLAVWAAGDRAQPTSRSR